MMAKRGAQTLLEINRQPEAWQHTIRRVEEAKGQLMALTDGVDEVVFTGSGSGYNVSLVLAPTFQHFTGVPSHSAPAAELIHFPETVFARKTKCLVVLITRSGETTEAIGACKAAKERGCRTLAITCHADSTLARLTDSALVLTEASERSVVTTQSLTSMVVCGQVFSALVAGDEQSLEAMRRLPECGRQSLAAAHRLGEEIAANEAIEKFAFAGNGPYLGLARECQLKLKEMVLQPSDAYPLFDFRHGPCSNVDEHMLVAVLVSDRAQREESAFLRDMRRLNGKLLVLCDRAEGLLTEEADYVFEVGSGLPDFRREVLYMPVIHYLAYHRALARGYDPDNPVNLTYWVDLTGS
jgi:glucosamine--fructose-6-phosphate aminotransferase (isomerizing)